MPTPPLTRDHCLEAVRLVKQFVDRGYELNPERGRKQAGAIRLAAEQAGVNPSTLRNRIDAAENRFGLTVENYCEAPDLVPDEYRDRPCPKEIRERAKVQTAKYITKARMKPAAFVVRPEPFGVAVMGDPHLSNKGCNMVELERDIELLRATQTRAIQVGDVLDNFWAAGPKLAGKEADNYMTRDEALSVAEWFVAESGVKWDGHILGNHDLWLGPTGVNLLAGWVANAKSRLFDWNGRFIYNWGSDQHVLAVSHDFKGHSKYNPLHGPGNMALFDGTADTYVAGHKHNHADMKVPNGYREKTYQLVRVRGYKDRDSYSEGRPQFAPLDTMEGRSALIAINPLSETMDGRQRVFMDLAEGIEWVEFLKRRHVA